MTERTCESCGKDLPSLYSLIRRAESVLDEQHPGAAMMVLNMNLMATNEALRCWLAACCQKGLLPDPEPTVRLFCHGTAVPPRSPDGRCGSCGAALPSLFELIRQSMDDLARASYAKTIMDAVRRMRVIAMRNRDALRCHVGCCGATALPQPAAEPEIALRFE